MNTIYLDKEVYNACKDRLIELFGEQEIFDKGDFALKQDWVTNK